MKQRKVVRFAGVSINRSPEEGPQTVPEPGLFTSEVRVRLPGSSTVRSLGDSQEACGPSCTWAGCQFTYWSQYEEVMGQLRYSGRYSSVLENYYREDYESVMQHLRDFAADTLEGQEEAEKEKLDWAAEVLEWETTAKLWRIQSYSAVGKPKVCGVEVHVFGDSKVVPVVGLLPQNKSKGECTKPEVASADGVLCDNNARKPNGWQGKSAGVVTASGQTCRLRRRGKMTNYLWRYTEQLVEKSSLPRGNLGRFLKQSTPEGSVVESISQIKCNDNHDENSKAKTMHVAKLRVRVSGAGVGYVYVCVELAARLHAYASMRERSIALLASMLARAVAWFDRHGVDEVTMAECMPGTLAVVMRPRKVELVAMGLMGTRQAALDMECLANLNKGQVKRASYGGWPEVFKWSWSKKHLSDSYVNSIATS